MGVFLHIFASKYIVTWEGAPILTTPLVIFTRQLLFFATLPVKGATYI
jgi:hypothetical protein